MKWSCSGKGYEYRQGGSEGKNSGGKGDVEHRPHRQGGGEGMKKSEKGDVEYRQHRQGGHEGKSRGGKGDVKYRQHRQGEVMVRAVVEKDMWSTGSIDKGA